MNRKAANPVSRQEWPIGEYLLDRMDVGFSQQPVEIEDALVAQFL